ncbi:toprim domain-containing protein [Mycoplasmopsis meleagridis]|uniref:toprim domain-containing protein n=1 Tax=Mycoplasmopsis meleagridis TaxID=29561 RepID=UPI003A8A43D7
MKIKTIEELNEKLAYFPGISKKQAEKMSNFLLTQEEKYIDELIDKLINFKKKINFCPQCNLLRENDFCSNCNEEKENNSLIIVENVAVSNRLSNFNVFQGYFYVLPYIIEPKSDLLDDKYEYNELFEYIAKHNFEEIIIMLSPSLNGELTTNYLLEKLKESKIKCTRAAIGMPMNSSIDYLDAFTLKQSLENRNSK